MYDREVKSHDIPGEHSNLKLQMFSVADDIVNPGDMLAGIESVLFSIRLKATMIEMSAG